MTTLIGPFMLGKHLTTCTLAGVDADAAGVLTAGTAQSLVDVIVRASRQLVKEGAQISPATSDKLNTVTVRKGHRASITALKGSNAAQKMDTIAFTKEYAKLIWTEGVTPGAVTYTGWYRVGDLEDGIDDAGQQVQTLNLEPVGLVGEDQVGRAVA